MTIAQRCANGTDPHERMIDRFRDEQLSKLDGLRDVAADQFDIARLIDQKRDQRTNNQNRELREMVARNEINAAISARGFRKINFRWDMSTEEISKTADDLAFLSQVIFEHGLDVKNQIKRLFRAINLESALPEKGVAERTQKLRWWRALLHRECRRRTEQNFRQLGVVSKQKGLYLSNFTFAGWKAAQVRAAEQMKSAELVDIATGEVISMEQASKGGVSNLENRRAELMTRISGCEELAEEKNLVPLFLTVTCPSKYHRFRGTRKNPKYNGSTPREAQDHLNGNWARIRARLKRLEIALFGLRIVEPHHEGCPHWHFLLFVEPIHKIALLEVIVGYSLQEDGDEPGAQQRRVEIVELDEASQATGYVAKYVAKNIDGFKVGEDHESDGQPAIETALRVRAWASTWGIRQFQFLGDAPVTVWREFRRVANDPEQAATVEGPPAIAMIAADDGNWAEYSKTNGGPCCLRAERPFRPHYSEIKPVSGLPRIGVYGEVLRAVVGIHTAAGVIISRSREWVLQFKRASAPWSCVNNCTGANLTSTKTSVGTVA